MTPETEITPAATEPLHEHDPLVIETVEQRAKRYHDGIKDKNKQGQENGTLIEFLRTKTTEVKSRDLQAHKSHLIAIDKTCKYLAGEFYGSWDADGNYTPYARLPNEVAYAVPTIIGHFNQALMMILKTDLAYERKSYDESNPAHVALNDMCEKIAMADFRRLMDEDARVDEGTNALTAGESNRLLMWGIHDNPKTIDKPIYEEAGWAIPETKQCNSCQMSVPADATECPECGSDWLKTIPASTDTRQVFKGTKKVPVGQNLLHIPHMTAVKSDLAAPDISSATYVIETDYLPNKRVAEWLYQCIIEEGDGRASDAVRMQREQRSATVIVGQQGAWTPRGDQSFDGAGQHGGKPIERNHVWLEVSEYGYKYFEQDEALPDGKHCEACGIIYDPAEITCAKCGADLEDGAVIKANQLMGEALPWGFKYCIVGKTCISGGRGDKKRQWKRLLYGKRPGSSRGVGIQPYLPLQDVENDVLSFELDILMTSVPFRAAVAKYVDKMPKAGEWLKLNQMPPNGNIDSVVKQYAAQTPSGVLGQMGERLESAGQFILGTQTVVGRTGDPSQKALGTAHGVAAVVEQQNGRFVTPTTQRVGCDKDLLDAILGNIRDFSSPEQRLELKKRFGDAADDFFKTDFEHIGYWDVKSGSDRPRSDALSGALMTEFGNLAATMMEKMPGVPWVSEFLSTLGDLIGIPFKMVPGGSDRHEATRRLRKLAAIERDLQKRKPELLQDAVAGAQAMFELLEEFIGPLSIETAMEEAKKHGDDSGINGAIPFLYMQDHMAMGEVYKEELFSDDAQMFSPARRAVISHMYALHVEGMAAAKNLEAEFTSTLAKKLNPQPDQKPTGAAKIIESIAYKDAPPDIKAQIEQAAGMTPSKEWSDPQTPATDGENGDAGQPPHPEEHVRAIDEKVIDHHLGEQAADAQLKRDLLKQSHKAETEIAAHEGKAAATARYSAFKPEKPE